MKKIYKEKKVFYVLSLLTAILLLFGCKNYVRAATCKSHNYGSWKITQQATCTKAGKKVRTCKKCGKKETKQIAAKGHICYGKYKIVYPTKHKKICGRCGKAYGTAVSHSYGSWKFTANPTCSQEGKMHKTCKFCGYVNEKTIPKNTKHLYKNGKCIRCGKKK